MVDPLTSRSRRIAEKVAERVLVQKMREVADAVERKVAERKDSNAAR